MPDFEEEVKATPPKVTSDFFVAVRERGFLNASLDELAKSFEADNPGRAAKWEFFRPSMDGGTDMVVNREAQGYELVDSKDWNMNMGSMSAQKEGPIRRGDLVLMSAPREIANMIRLQDAEAAHADLNAPKAAFEENVNSNKVKLSDGTLKAAEPFGTIKQSVEQVAKTAASD